MQTGQKEEKPLRSTLKCWWEKRASRRDLKMSDTQLKGGNSELKKKTVNCIWEFPYLMGSYSHKAFQQSQFGLRWQLKKKLSYYIGLYWKFYQADRKKSSLKKCFTKSNISTTIFFPQTMLRSPLKDFRIWIKKQTWERIKTPTHNSSSKLY